MDLLSLLTFYQKNNAKNTFKISGTLWNFYLKENLKETILKHKFLEKTTLLYSMEG